MSNANQLLMSIFDILSNRCVMWSDWKEQIERCPKIRQGLLWEYDLKDFDWQYMRALVVERVIERGWDEDYYALFALYGGMDGVRQIIRDEVLLLSDKDIAFVCAAFNLKKEELKCYIRNQSRQALINS
jgi:hypothetical protein